jgi:CRISPR-associated endonuclease/helicase Cas3
MTNYAIALQPLYSRLCEQPPEGIILPPDWSSLSWHQGETVAALRESSIDVVFNTAVTGDGKSLAAYLPAMTSRTYTLAAYPTNELARDQERQVRGYKCKFQPEYDPQIYRLNAAILEEFIETNQLPSKQAGLLNRSDNSEILLTNPDIFHYIHDFRYLRRNKEGKGDNPNRLFANIDKNYNLFVFDEFHIFSSPQITNILNAILLIKQTVPGKQFLFLSATPNEFLQDYLSKAGLKYRVINPVAQGAYRFSVEDSDKNWRPISQPIELRFPRNLEPNFRSSYDWIVENAESILLMFFQEYPGSKGAIILNSIAAVKTLLPRLKQLFEPLGFQVRENTGLTGETEKAKSVVEADLLIGTSTIDVGVDFRINFLVFEAADAGNFIQRLGRLGRHKGFEMYQAYALLPKFIVERLFEVESLPLQDGETYDRLTFFNTVRANFAFVNEFKYYPSRWGGIQSACVYSELLRLTQRYPEAASGFGNDIQKALGVSVRKKFGQIKHCQREGKQKVIDEARSFRGSSQLNCAIYDATNPDEPESERFKIYNLPSLLSNFTVEWWEKERFMRCAKKADVATHRFEQALAYFKLTGYRDVRENWHFYYGGELGEMVKSGKVQVLKGLEIWQPHGRDINQISQRVSRRGFVCFICDRDRATVRARLGLPIHFQVYGLSNQLNDTNPGYSIAFGQSALLLETLAWHWQPQEDDGWVC